ncbi:MAG: hypothetical protein MUE30_16440 [Spirosomaceae bacterium]|nr:hypothetical protein [Spirosomataceae bacterium]
MKKLFLLFLTVSNLILGQVKSGKPKVVAPTKTTKKTANSQQNVRFATTNRNSNQLAGNQFEHPKTYTPINELHCTAITLGPQRSYT